MIRFFTRLFVYFAFITILLPTSAFSQVPVTLGTSPYTETFDNIGTAGVPAGFFISATGMATSLGTAATLTTAATAWNNTTGAFKNFASADIGAAGTQATATDRALGVRQTGAFGDPGASFVFQIANTTGKTGFKLAFKLQSLDASSQRITTWQVQYGLGASPTTFTSLPSANITGTLTTGNLLFTNYADTADFSNILDNIAGVVTIRIIALTATTSSNNRASSAIDDFSLSWTAGPSTTPTITINNNGATTLQFPSTPINTTSAAQTYTVNAVNLIAPLVVTTAAPFKVSSDGTTFSISITIAPNGSGTVAQNIYVNFTPTTSGAVSGTITNASTNATTKSVTPSGEAIDPNNLSFNFNTCTNLGVPGSGFYAYNVIGPQVWTCTSFGTNGTNGVNINGYSGTAINNEDWLISPPLKISGLTTPVLSFNSKGEYSGPVLQLLASTNYDGVGNPADSSKFTWTALNGNFLTPSGGALSTFNFSDNINLSSYKSASKLYIAFKYLSDTIAGAARWTLDDININDRSTLFSVSPTQLFYSETSVGTFSAGQAVALQSLGYKDVTVAAPSQFQVSLNNSIFTNSILIDSITAKTGTTFYVRFAPTTKVINQTGLLHFTATGLDTSFVALSGSSYPKSETIDIACFNMSFFGAGSNNDETPALRNLQKTNLEAVYTRLNADIIGVEEVSSDSVFNKLVSELPGYAGFLSPKWSYFFQPFDASQPGFPPQKIGFIYNTNTVKLIDSHVIDGAQYDSVRAGTLKAWTDYPTGDPTSFFSSGRLPIMATFDVTIGGITKRIRMVDIHAKALGDLASYNRRVYDAKVLKDTLDKYYANDNVIIVGDYNDRLVSSIYLSNPTSPYNPFVADKAGYKALTYSLDSAGRSSFVGSTGMIDQIICSNELIPNYIPNSTDIEPANTYISPYTATTASDHLPVFSRFVMNAVTPLAFANCPNVNIAVARPGYNTYNNEGVNLYTVDTTTGSATLIPSGPLLETNANKNMDLNGVGLNSTDGFLYGIRDTGTAATNKAMLYRVGANYGVQLLGTISAPTLLPGENMSAVNPAAGSFDGSGNYYFTGVSGIVAGSQGIPTNYYIGKITGLSSLAPGSGTITPTYTKIDFSGANCSSLYTNLVSTVPISGSGSSAGTGIEDIAYNNAFNSLYFFSAFQSPLGSGNYQGQLVRVAPATGVATCYIAISPFSAANTKNEVSGILSTANGNLIIYMTSGSVFKTIKGASGDFVGLTPLNASGIPSAGATGSIRGDLASCGLGKPALGSIGSPSLPQGVTAYPNPARGVTTIATTSALKNATVSLIGLAGNVILRTTGVSGNTFQLNLTNTPSGVYMVEINQDGNVSRMKIVKE